MDISLLSVSRAPCVPFSSRPRRNAGQYCRSKQLVRCAAQNEEEGDKKNEIARNLGKVCAPFAAAMLLMVNSQPHAVRRCYVAQQPYAAQTPWKGFWIKKYAPDLLCGPEAGIKGRMLILLICEFA